MTSPSWQACCKRLAASCCGQPSHDRNNLRPARNFLRPKALCPVSRSVWELLEEASRPPALRSRDEGGALRRSKEALLTGFEVVTYGALLLLLPCVIAQLIFGCPVTDTLVQVVLVGIAGTAILTTIAVHEGWYLEHLSGWGLAGDRVEPSLRAQPPSPPGTDGGDGRSG